jgi:hypothetical protein
MASKVMASARRLAGRMSVKKKRSKSMEEDS